MQLRMSTRATWQRVDDARSDPQISGQEDDVHEPEIRDLPDRRP